MIVGSDQSANFLEVGYIDGRSHAERRLLEAIRTARAAGISWSAIGVLVGISGEAARQRYSGKVA